MQYDTSKLYNKSKDTKENKKIGKQARDSGKNEPHGDGGRAEEKGKKQIEDLEKQFLKAKTRREKVKIRSKMKKIAEEAAKKKKGETHHRK